MLRSALLLSVSVLALLVASMPAAAQWIQFDKLTASDAAAGDEFGLSVAISGNTAIVGAFADDDAGSRSGSAYLFDVNSREQLFKLTAEDASNSALFGYSVAISGNTAIVGARSHDNTGSAYLFNVDSGKQLFELIADDAATGDKFGHSVAISGNTAIVGAFFDDDAGSESGSAYLFDVDTGKQRFKLTTVASSAGDMFGHSVAISGNTAIVGAPYNNDAGLGSGSAYLFDVDTGKQRFNLTATDADGEDAFGISVGISGNTAIVGAFGDDDAAPASGSAYLFDVDSGKQVFKLTADDAAAIDRFGYSVGISGNTAIVGAFADDDAGSCSGSAYLFDVDSREQLFKLTAADAAGDDFFGLSVAISGNTAIVGANKDDDGGIESGSAYVFVPEPSTFILLSMGAVGLLAYAWRRKRQIA